MVKYKTYNALMDAYSKYGVNPDSKFLACEIEKTAKANKCMEDLSKHYEFGFSADLTTYNSIGFKF